MINEEHARKYCCEDISKIYGYAEAVADKENMWHCHHCLGLVYSKEQLKEKRLYYKQPADMLLFCTKSEHEYLHHIKTPRCKEIQSNRAMGLRGHKVSVETKMKISSAKKGGVFTEEHKRNLSISHKGKVQTEEEKIKKGKRVLQFTLNGDFIAEHKTITEAAKVVGGKKGSISKCCLGILKSYLGFIWKYPNNMIYH